MSTEYGAIMADPPWNFKTWSKKGQGRSASRHYHITPFADLCVPDDVRLADDCVLFLWVTDPTLPLGLQLMGDWGFTYKTVAFTWVKTTKDGSRWLIGCGYWTRANPEMCLLGTRGKPKRISRSVPQLLISPRREHSRKPDEVYGRIEALVPGPYVELFARHRWPGWDAWGDELDQGA